MWQQSKNGVENNRLHGREADSRVLVISLSMPVGGSSGREERRLEAQCGTRRISSERPATLAGLSHIYVKDYSCRFIETRGSTIRDTLVSGCVAPARATDGWDTVRSNRVSPRISMVLCSDRLDRPPLFGE